MKKLLYFVVPLSLLVAACGDVGLAADGTVDETGSSVATGESGFGEITEEVFAAGDFLGVERDPLEPEPIELVSDQYEGIDYDAEVIGLALDELLSGGITSEFPEPVIDLGDIRPGFGAFSPDIVDRIPPIDEPEFTSIEDATYLAGDEEPVVFAFVNGDARAFPLKVLIAHEIVNTTVGDIPVAVTFCPLCNSALVVDRRVGNRELTFGVSGTLLNSALLMWDRETSSLWSHFTGEGVVGHYAGAELDVLPSQTISFGQFRRAFPDGQVLSEFHEENSSPGRYGENAYAGAPVGFLFDGEFDDRLPEQELVVGVEFQGEATAIRFADLQAGGVQYFGADDRLVALHVSGSSAAFDGADVNTGSDIGQTGVFVAELDGESLELAQTEGGALFEDQLGNQWNIFGQAVSGPNAGEALEQINHLDVFWFAWAAYQPETTILGS